jgi:hypothetical protein
MDCLKGVSEMSLFPYSLSPFDLASSLEHTWVKINNHQIKEEERTGRGSKQSPDWSQVSLTEVKT